MDTGIFRRTEKILEQLGHRAALVIAAKYATKEQVCEALRAGATHIGFNTYRQMKELLPGLPATVKTHFIGTLQTNKAKKVVALDPFLIQSVDSLRLVEFIDRAAEQENKLQNILVQVKTDSKKSTGIPPSGLGRLLRGISSLENTRIRGLMTVHPYSADPESSRPCFRDMKKYFTESENILGRKLDYLSMGMSADYMTAIEEGSSMVRIGSMIFKQAQI